MLSLKRLAVLAGLLSSALALNFTEADFDDLEERAGYNEHNECRPGGLQIVALGGEETTPGDLGYLQSLANAIKSRIPNSEIKQIGYPEGADPPTSIAYGKTHLHRHLSGMVKRCPGTQMAILGYSVGAAAVMDVWCGNVDTGKGAISKKYTKHVIGSIVYGDLTYVDNLSYNKGTCTSHPGVVPRQFPGKCYPYGNHLQSYCDEGDPQCCGDGTNGDPQIHFSYPSKYDGAASDYIVRRWHTHQRKKGHN